MGLRGWGEGNVGIEGFRSWSLGLMGFTREYTLNPKPSTLNPKPYVDISRTNYRRGVSNGGSLYKGYMEAYRGHGGYIRVIQVPYMVIPCCNCLRYVGFIGGSFGVYEYRV